MYKVKVNKHWLKKWSKTDLRFNDEIVYTPEYVSTEKEAFEHSNISIDSSINRLRILQKMGESISFGVKRV